MTWDALPGRRLPRSMRSDPSILTHVMSTHGSLDTLSPQARRERMSRVRATNTKPELRVRRIVHALGYRYRLHGADLPGKPDLVFRSARKVIFVHGCFWHRHPGCSRNRLPKSPERRAFWRSKLNGNASRDQSNQDRLQGNGWSVLVIWECETKNVDLVTQRVEDFMGKV